MGWNTECVEWPLAIAISMPLVTAAAWAQNNATSSERLGTLAQTANPGTCPGNPGSLGVARVVEIDSTGGQGFGFEHFKSYDFLRDGEVVLTFDDGPWPDNTPAVLRALSEQCTKAMFFPIGKHAIWHPEILKQVAAAGHTIGSHTWSHADLSKLTADQAEKRSRRASARCAWRSASQKRHSSTSGPAALAGIAGLS